MFVIALVLGDRGWAVRADRGNFTVEFGVTRYYEFRPLKRVFQMTQIEKSQPFTVVRPNVDFGGYEGASIEGFEIDYSGARRRLAFNVSGPQTPGILSLSGLPLDKETFEWLDIIESIEAARSANRGQYVFAEFGAGYGRWGVRAHLMAQRAHLSAKLILVEAEPTHLEWLPIHLSDNGIPAEQATIHKVALAPRIGESLFYVEMPLGCSGNSPAEWYGQSLIKDYEKPMREDQSRTGFFGRFLARGRAFFGVSQPPPQAGSFPQSSVLLQSGWRAVKVPTIRLRDCIPSNCIIDLADFDIQGSELDVIKESIDVCDASIRMLHIGTHGDEIERELRQLLIAHDWLSVRDYQLASVNETQFGAVHFVDGVQTWINPRLRRPEYVLGVTPF
jgi:hypothetical protein